MAERGRGARRFSSVQDAATMLGCSIETVRRMIARGEITAYRVGKRLLRVDLDEIADAMTVVPTAGTPRRVTHQQRPAHLVVQPS